MIASLFFTFCVGALFDFVWVAYTASFISKRPAPSAVMAMWLGAASLCGMGAGLHDSYHGWALVLGYGAGTYAGARWL